MIDQWSWLLPWHGESAICPCEQTNIHGWSIFLHYIVKWLASLHMGHLLCLFNVCCKEAPKVTLSVQFVHLSWLSLLKAYLLYYVVLELLIAALGILGCIAEARMILDDSLRIMIYDLFPVSPLLSLFLSLMGISLVLCKTIPLI